MFSSSPKLSLSRSPARSFIIEALAKERKKEREKETHNNNTFIILFFSFEEKKGGHDKKNDNRPRRNGRTEKIMASFVCFFFLSLSFFLSFFPNSLQITYVRFKTYACAHVLIYNHTFHARERERERERKKARRRTLVVHIVIALSFRLLKMTTRRQRRQRRQRRD